MSEGGAFGAESRRLSEDSDGVQDWRLWGTYLPERQWGTVREDYSANGSAWESLPYDESRLRAYRWGEDGLLGWTDRESRLCFSLALWNGRDPHLKEKLFGLSNTQGNHGEDVKELYYYLDATPTHSYARALYKYPQAAFPYSTLTKTNQSRGFHELEYEIIDTGVFADDRYFDVSVEYAKRAPDDTLIRVTVSNRGPETSELSLLPTLAFRNTWAWDERVAGTEKPELSGDESSGRIIARHHELGTYVLTMIDGPEARTTTTLFTENDSNRQALGWEHAGTGYSKDAFHRFVVGGDASAVNMGKHGTKAAFLSRLCLAPGASVALRLRLARQDGAALQELPASAFDACIAQRVADADAFYAALRPPSLGADEHTVMRQAYAGLLWSKQVYHYDVTRWLKGDPTQPPPPKQRTEGRNSGWRHLLARDVLSMPDKWEYPWFAAWDLAFHTIPLCDIDPAFAKSQLLLMLDERYLHPNGALPAYEFGFDEVNPPVHAMAVWQVYETDRKRTGTGDIEFLENAFLKLLLSFTWWVNRNDPSGRDLFGGGFLGLDNIGLFDRNQPLPDGGQLTQADATAWMGLFCSAMQGIAVELAQTRPVHQAMAVKFFHHLLLIIDAINSSGGSGLWDEETGFFYDQVVFKGKEPVPLKVQSIVGLVPLFALSAIRRDQRDRVPEVIRQVEAGLKGNMGLAGYVGEVEAKEGPFAGSHFVALVPKERLLRVLDRMLDEAQFLSPYGIRSLSKAHADQPFTIQYDGKTLSVGYVPGEGNSRAFGGNSNWRGPIWFPINILIIHALQRHHEAYGDQLTVECPTGSGQRMTLEEVARELSRRLTSLFLPDGSGRRPCHGEEARYAEDPHWRDLVLFNEYFHGDTGRGLGASHQTGWTATVATCIGLQQP